MRGERLLAVSLVIVAATGRASAHPVGGTRFDASVPLWIVLVGAGVTVALTAVVLTRVGEPAPRTRRLVTLPTAAVGVASRVAGVAFLLAVVAAIADGISGPQRPLSNVATLFVWALWLKGVALVVVTAGSPWRALSPWRTVYRGLWRSRGRRSGCERTRPHSVRGRPCWASSSCWASSTTSLSSRGRQQALPASSPPTSR
jgi:hypothetical protein